MVDEAAAPPALLVCELCRAGAHAAEEWVDIESVAQLAEILVRAALDYCQ